MKRIAMMFVLGTAALSSVPAFAAPGPGSAATTGPGTTAVKQANETIQKLLKNKAPAAKVTSSVNDIIDIDELGKRAMGDNWAKMSAADQKAFLDKLHALIEANYVQGMNANLDYKVDYTGESTDAAGNVTVKTTITAQKKGRPTTIPVDYKLAKQNGKLKAYDVVTDDVGLVDNYKQQFDKIIAKDGVSGLIKKLDAKIDELNKKTAATPAKP